MFLGPALNLTDQLGPFLGQRGILGGEKATRPLSQVRRVKKSEFGYLYYLFMVPFPPYLPVRDLIHSNPSTAVWCISARVNDGVFKETWKTKVF